MFRKLSLLLCSVVSASAFCATSVWEEARTDGNVMTGKVVSIATDNDEILVRIASGEKTETFKVCTSYPGGDGLNMSENERMKSLRDAFNHGDTVKAAFNGPFDRCLSRVEITKPVGTPEKIHAVSKADHPRKPSSLN